MSDQTKMLVSDFFGGQWNWEKTAALDRWVSPDYVYHGPRGDLRGVRAFREQLLAELEGLDGVFIRVDEIISEGDRVAVRYTCWFENRGEVMGALPTGKTIRQQGCSVHRVEGERVVETWDAYDRSALLTDLAVRQHLGEQDEAAIRQAAREFLTAKNGSLSLRTSHFAPNAEVVPARGRVLHGQEAIAVWLEEIEPLPEWRAADLEIEGAGDMAFVRGRYSMLIHRRGENTHHDKGMYVEIWRRLRESDWKVVWNMFSSDFSVPVAVPAPAALSAL